MSTIIKLAAVALVIGLCAYSQASKAVAQTYCFSDNVGGFICSTYDNG
jgi:hypothetical protein